MERKDGWITCRIDGFSPAQAIKTIVNDGLPIIEAEAMSETLENLYMTHTTGVQDDGTSQPCSI
jgi:hypothetical protein